MKNMAYSTSITLKNIMLLVLFLLFFTNAVDAGQLDNATYPVLVPNPLIKSCGMARQCIDNENNRETWNTMCFTGLCSENQTVHCVDHKQYKGTKDDGAVYYCAEPRTCDKGTMDRFTYDEKNKEIRVQNVECPRGYHQPFGDLCNKTCGFTHKLTDTPSHVIVLFPGNASHSAVGMCNIRKGYFLESPFRNETTFNLSEHPDPCVHYRHSEHFNCLNSQGFCANGSCTGLSTEGHRRDPCDCGYGSCTRLCTEGHRRDPCDCGYGSCTSLCTEGHKRDPCDCGCKPINDSVCAPPQFNITNNTWWQDPIVYNTTNHPIVVTLKPDTDVIHTESSPQVTPVHNTSSNHMTIVITLFICIGVVIVLSVVTLVCQYCNGKRKVITIINTLMKKNTVYQVDSPETVYIGVPGNAEVDVDIQDSDL